MYSPIIQGRLALSQSFDSEHPVKTRFIQANTVYKDAEIAIAGRHGIDVFYVVKGVTRLSKSIYIHTTDNFTMVFSNRQMIREVVK